MPYGYGSANQSGTSSGRDTGSNYGQFDRAVSRAANNPPASTPSGNGDNYQDRIQRIAAEQARAAEQIAQEKSTAEREMRETIAEAKANKKIVNELLNQEGIGSIDVGFQNELRKQQIRNENISKQQDPDYGQFFRPTPVVEKPKSNFWKGLGNVAMSLVPGLLPGKLGTMARFGKTAYDYSQGKGLAYNLIQGLNFNNPLKKRTTTAKLPEFLTKHRNRQEPRFDDIGGGDKQIIQASTTPENVIEKGTQQFSPEQIKFLRQRYEQLQEVMKTGMLGERKLTMDELSRLGQISNQMEQYLVDPKELLAARGGIARLYG